MTKRPPPKAVEKKRDILSDKIDHDVLIRLMFILLTPRSIFEMKKTVTSFLRFRLSSDLEESLSSS